MVKKRGINETMSLEEEESVAVIDVSDAQVDAEQVNSEENDYTSLVELAQETKKRPDIVGYILKSEEKATVDLDEPEKMIEYAMLSSQAFESAQSLTDEFELGQTESIVIEGKTLKALCIDLGQNKISIFMKRNVDHASILKDFTS